MIIILLIILIVTLSHSCMYYADPTALYMRTRSSRHTLYATVDGLNAHNGFQRGFVVTLMGGQSFKGFLVMAVTDGDDLSSRVGSFAEANPGESSLTKPLCDAKVRAGGLRF